MRDVQMTPLAIDAQAEATVGLARGGGVDIVDADGHRLVTAPFSRVEHAAGLIRVSTAAPSFVIRSGDAKRFLVHGPDPRNVLWSGTVGTNTKTEQFDMNVPTTSFVEGVAFDLKELTHQIPAKGN